MRIDDKNLINCLNIMFFSYSFELSDVKQSLVQKNKLTWKR